jgi:UDP-N-acetyl-2-amino-2-deoxyglucuronate dehydrogenase
MEKRNPVRFAVVGCGHIGKRHAEMISRNNDAELVALADIQKKENLGIDRYQVPFFNSLEEFIQNKVDADVVVIATPNGYHALQAMKCLSAGYNVVVEKPMALRRRDAEMLIFKALQANRHVFAVMQNRYSPPSMWLKEMIDSGILGDIYMVQLNCYWNRDERYYKPDSWHGSRSLDGGTLYTQFSHFIDIMYWLMGDIENIHSNITCNNHHHLTDFEDSGFVTFDFCNGGTGSLNFSTSVWDRNLESSMTIIAENGSIKVGGQYMNEVEYCHVRDYVMPVLAPTNPGNDYGAYKGSAANHHYIVENVINVLRGHSTITTNALEGLKVVDIIERIYAAAKPVNETLPSLRQKPATSRPDALYAPLSVPERLHLIQKPVA